MIEWNIFFYIAQIPEDTYQKRISASKLLRDAFKGKNVGAVERKYIVSVPQIPAPKDHAIGEVSILFR